MSDYISYKDPNHLYFFITAECSFTILIFTIASDFSTKLTDQEKTYTPPNLKGRGIFHSSLTHLPNFFCSPPFRK